MPATSLDGMSMDDIKIGPDGETFGELRRDVLNARAAFMSALVQGQATDRLMDTYNRATQRLNDAYARVGLPYTAP